MTQIFNLGWCDIPNCKGQNIHCWNVWKGMIKRVATQKGSYKGVHISREWTFFSKFLAWYQEQTILPGSQLDKDLLSEGKHDHYGPDVCVFLPREINQSLQRHRGWERRDGAFVPVFHRGGQVEVGPRMIDQEGARQWYIKRKKEWLNQLANQYEPFLSERIISALRKYDFS